MTEGQERLRAKRIREAREERTRLDAAHDEEFARELAEATRVAAEVNGLEPEEILSATDPLQATFWDRPSLDRIRQFARAHRAGPEAVLANVLLRVVSEVPPNVMTPPLIGAPGSLNLFVATVGRSGSGKGLATAVAGMYWPTDTPELPIGSGEGIEATFIGEDATSRAIFTASEVDTLRALGDRSGSTLFSTLRSLAMGETLGKQNASKDRRRVVPAHSYRAGLEVGVQPARAEVLLGDAAGGTPQRFVWVPSDDPGAPDVRPPSVEPMKPGGRPVWGTKPTELVFNNTARDEVDAYRLRVLRGDPTVDPLDGHSMITRTKVAAALALLEGRTVVDQDDWTIAGEIMVLSDATRQGIIDATRAESRKVNAARAHAAADREDMISDRRLERAKQAVLRWLDRCGELASRDLRPKLKADLRDQFSTAVAELEADGAIASVPVANGVRYRLAGVPAVPAVQPQKSQVASAVPEVQRVLHVLPNAEAPQTCRQWLDTRITALIDSGATTASSAEVYAEGQAAGYRIDNLRQAASKSGLIAIARKLPAGGAIWNIGVDAQSTAVPCSQWIITWLRERGEWVSAGEVIAAGEAAGYGRTAIKSASLAAHVLKRGQSTLTEWRLDPEYVRRSA